MLTALIVVFVIAYAAIALEHPLKVKGERVWRSYQGGRELDRMHGEADPADGFALAQESERLGVALAALPEAQRMLIQKAYFGELSHGEIAAETGLPLGTIKSRIRLALDRLRRQLT